MSPELRGAYDRLDQARTRAQRIWKESLLAGKEAGWPFEYAKEYAWWQLYCYLEPWYKAVEDAASRRA